MTILLINQTQFEKIAKNIFRLFSRPSIKLNTHGDDSVHNLWSGQN